MEILSILVTCLFTVLTWFTARVFYSKELAKLLASFEEERADISKLAKKRSGAVQWGKSIEQFIPFTTEFPLPPEDVTFLGMPIDYVGFTDTGSETACTVHFIEVKSGKSVLSKKQWNIRKAIREGRVKWHEISVDGNPLKTLD
jgi:predicted Holliday junction resolvase-like endonuclease